MNRGFYPNSKELFVTLVNNFALLKSNALVVGWYKKKHLTYIRLAPAGHALKI